MIEARHRGVLPIVLLAVVLMVVALAWFRAPALHPIGADFETGGGEVLQASLDHAGTGR